jgi:ESCRT-I complex subunit TSG101
MQEAFSREPPVYAKPKPSAIVRATPTPGEGSPDYAERPPPPIPSSSSSSAVTIASGIGTRPNLPPKPSTPAGSLSFQSVSLTVDCLRLKTGDPTLIALFFLSLLRMPF